MPRTFNHHRRIPNSTTSTAPLGAKTRGTILRTAAAILTLNVLPGSLTITQAAGSDRAFPGILGRRGPEWSVLKDRYLSRRRRTATSVSFLLDRNGRIRFVYPGPEFHPTDDPGARQIHQDYLDVENTIKVLLDE